MPNIKKPMTNRQRRINSMMKYKKKELENFHRAKHPADPALYKKQKKDIARAILVEQWWPVRDFPVTIGDEKKTQH